METASAAESRTRGCYGVLSASRIQEPRVTHAVSVDRELEMGAHVTNIIRRQHPAFPEFVLHTDIELVRTRILEIGRIYGQTL